MVISICKSMSILVVFLSALLILPIFGYSQQAKILPGTYVTKGGWGNMSIAKKNGSLVFEINAISTMRVISAGACHYYCGARAGFTGLYMIPAVSCS